MKASHIWVETLILWLLYHLSMINYHAKNELLIEVSSISFNFCCPHRPLFACFCPQNHDNQLASIVCIFLLWLRNLPIIGTSAHFPTLLITYQSRLITTLVLNGALSPQQPPPSLCRWSLLGNSSVLIFTITIRISITINIRISTPRLHHQPCLDIHHTPNKRKTWHSPLLTIFSSKSRGENHLSDRRKPVQK